MLQVIARAIDSDIRQKMFAAGLVSALLAVSLVGTIGYLGGAFHPAFPPSHLNMPVYTIDNIVASNFADFEPHEESFVPNAPEYTVYQGLSNVVNLGQFGTLPSDLLLKIEMSGFAAATQIEYKQIHEILELNDDEDIPSFVSSDAVLHAFHVLYDLALREVEVYSFWDLLGNLTASMLDSSYGQYLVAPEGRWKEAALRNMMFLTVALKLIDSNYVIPPAFPVEIGTEVTNVLTLIDAHNEMTDEWFQGYREDFTQFVPRGHYTRSETLERYFQAMMWFGRVSFRLQPDLPEFPNDKGMDNTAQAILISLALMDEISTLPAGIIGYDLWDAIYEPTVFFVGSADDLLPTEYLELVQTIYGSEVTIVDLDDDALLEDFIDAALEFREPAILGHPVADFLTLTQTMGLRFMGQRYIPDSYILGQLVYKNVGTMSNPRLMPMGLDVMAALGSERAWELLEPERDYENYESQMSVLWEMVANITDAEWTSNLYYLWLYSLLPLLSDPGEGYPFFMQSEAWVDKQLSTALGSWAELRHDTILYAKQSYTWELTAMPPPVRGYVEPVPRVYARLASLCKMMIDGLDSRTLLSTLIDNKLNALYDLLLDLQTISIKELEGTPLTESEYYLIEGCGKTLGSIVALPQDDYLTSDADDDMAVIADVHTDPNTSSVLEEAVGRPMVIYVAVEVDGQVILTRGGVFSYYEFTWPMDDRLTDEAWQDMLTQDEVPHLPTWTASFVTDSGVTLLAASAITSKESE
ncbi:MAG: DUF3160 domain-containing protein [Candidatus Thorarchaeota archaeon]